LLEWERRPIYSLVLILGSPLYVITAILLALGIEAVAFKNGDSRFKTTSAKPDPTAGRGTPKSSFRMTKKLDWSFRMIKTPQLCHSEP